MEVANRGAAPARLAVAASGNVGEVVGSVDPSVIPPGRTVTVNFFVPHAGQWAIWANGGELMGGTLSTLSKKYFDHDYASAAADFDMAALGQVIE